MYYKNVFSSLLASRSWNAWSRNLDVSTRKYRLQHVFNKLRMNFETCLFIICFASFLNTNMVVILLQKDVKLHLFLFEGTS